LRRHHTEREADGDDVVGQALGCMPAPLDDGGEAKLLGVAEVIGKLGEILPS
jgi:hypothetical protein